MTSRRWNTERRRRAGQWGNSRARGARLPWSLARHVGGKEGKREGLNTWWGQLRQDAIYRAKPTTRATAKRRDARHAGWEICGPLCKQLNRKSCAHRTFPLIAAVADRRVTRLKRSYKDDGVSLNAAMPLGRSNRKVEHRKAECFFVLDLHTWDNCSFFQFKLKNTHTHWKKVF